VNASSSRAPGRLGESRSRSGLARGAASARLVGVGPATAAKLEKLGLRYVRDLAQVDESTLASHVGLAMAASLSAYAIGEDYRESLPNAR